MCASVFTANGTLLAGDNNYNLYRSDNKGVTFRLIYQFPKQPNPNSAIAGYVMNVYVDSRNYFFISIPATNRLYRSTNFGSSFTEVLNTNGSQNDGLYITLTEDSQGNLYTATYCNSISPLQPSVLESIDGGATWKIIATFDSVHLHAVKFNPSNGFLYVATSEWTQGYSNTQCERIFRSKDLGKTWSIVVNRPAEIQGYGPTIYAQILFNESWVYLGTDKAYQINDIERFYDNGSNIAFIPQTVYTFPSDCAFPVISAVWLDKTMLFSSTAEFYNGTSRIVASDDGLNWQIIKDSAVSQSSHHAGVLTSNPLDMAFYSYGSGQTFMVTQQNVTPPTSTPLPAVSPAPTASPTATPTQSPVPTPIPTSTPSPTPTLNPTPTMEPTSMPQPPETPTSNDTPDISPTPTTPTATSSPQTDSPASIHPPTPNLPSRTSNPNNPKNNPTTVFSVPEYSIQTLGIVLVVVLFSLIFPAIIGKRRKKNSRYCPITRTSST
jgi:hypothetical protein